jgi:hypothetical protein
MNWRTAFEVDDPSSVVTVERSIPLQAGAAIQELLQEYPGLQVLRHRVAGVNDTEDAVDVAITVTGSPDILQQLREQEGL